MQKKYFDPEIAEIVSQIPTLDFSDAAAFRDFLAEANETAKKNGIVRLVDDQVEETEKTIPSSDTKHEIPIRIYMPKGEQKGLRPTYVSLHGGGFISGDLETEHKRCLLMAAKGGAVSVGVEYRLAPEYPFPAGAEDCYEALEWVAANASTFGIDESKIVVGGGSAGGNMSAAVALMARDRNGPDIAMQILLYPALDDRCDSPSMQNGKGLPLFSQENAVDCWKHYLGANRDKVSPYAAPARADDLSNLPPAYVLTCEHDPLRDEGIDYAMRLMAAGVSVELHNYPGVPHAFDLLLPGAVSERATNEYLQAFINVVG